MAPLRWVPSVCLVALAVGCAARPGEGLIKAAARGNAAEVQTLLGQGAAVDEKASTTGATALIVASEDGYREVVEALLAKGANVNAQRNDGKTALIIAAAKGNVWVAQLLLAKGAAINMKEESGSTALMAAAKRGHLDVVQLLLAKGAEVNARATDGGTALTLATQDDIKAVLIKAGAKR
jgi:ankyrin repeat protein